MKKKLFLAVLMAVFCLTAFAQEYSIKSAGQGRNGNYYVEVTSYTKNKPDNPEDVVLRDAVHGVLFRGFMSTESYGSQKALISDPNIEQARADVFKAFFGEKLYRNYASIEGTSLVSMKNKQTKSYETTAKILVNKEALLHYLESKGIINGFSNLW